MAEAKLRVIPRVSKNSIGNLYLVWEPEVFSIAFDSKVVEDVLSPAEFRHGDVDGEEVGASLGSSSSKIMSRSPYIGDGVLSK